MNQIFILFVIRRFRMSFHLFLNLINWLDFFFCASSVIFCQIHMNIEIIWTCRIYLDIELILNALGAINKTLQFGF